MVKLADMQTKSVQVDLGPRSYPVLIGTGLLAQAGKQLREQKLGGTNAFVLTNKDVGGLYFETLRDSLMLAGFTKVVKHEIPTTEEGKSWEELSKGCAALLESFPDTGSVPLVILLGGGVIGDLGGFVAGLFRRGVPFVQMPTTLLAAVDSSVGGKVAVNFGGVKNIMGIFNQPRLVLCDLALLRTLSGRELRSGMSEVVKYGAVCSRALFEDLERGALEKMLDLDGATLVEVVTRCVELKACVVEQDEFDKKGIRNVLNFGHTIGHALELSADYALTHGEAIAIGMVAATRIARALDYCTADFESRLRGLIERVGLPTVFADAPGLFDRVMAAMRMDKKFREGRNVFVLPTGIGEWRQAEGVPDALIESAVRAALV